MQYRKVLYSRHEKIITITLTVQCGLHLSDEQPSPLGRSEKSLLPELPYCTELHSNMRQRS